MTTKSQPVSNKIDKEDFVLVKGEFSPDDALEVINHLITEKINFHNLKSFSCEIRFGYPDKTSSKRIEELRQCKKSIKSIIQSAKNDCKELHIYSTITIKII